MSKRKELLFIAILVVFSLGWLAHTQYIRVYGGMEAVQVREDSSRYQFINPLIYVDNSSIVFEELTPLKYELEDFISTQVAENKIDQASVYFRNLNSGHWTGVDEDEKYVPASIFKVPTVMMYLKLAEDNPGIVEQKSFYKRNPNERQNYPPTEQLMDGWYPVNQLIWRSLVESDNAANIALAAPKENELAQLLKTLRLPILPKTGEEDFVSPREVSIIFRSLYSSTYLLDSYSEQLLALLTQTTFNKGLTQGVSPSVKVAHKFGEHTVYYTDPSKTPDYELHDCGIIYYPKKPYLLCVMTKGKKLGYLEGTIGQLSTITFSFMSGR